MHNQLTAVDIKKMQEEVEYRTCVLRPQLLKEVVRTRAFGDLSENAEYHIAKQEKNANERRIRFLKNMINTAVVVEIEGDENTVGLFDTIKVYVPEDDCEEQYQIVTTMRAEIMENRISNESPAGKALLGKKIGETVTIDVNPNYSYDVIIREIIKGTDDENIQLR